MSIFLEIMGIVLGVLVIIKTEWIVENFGYSAWAEQHLGTEGGTRIMYKFIGLTMIVLSVLAMTGLLGTIFISMFGRLFGIKNS